MNRASNHSARLRFSSKTSSANRLRNSTTRMATTRGLQSSSVRTQGAMIVTSFLRMQSTSILNHRHGYGKGRMRRKSNPSLVNRNASRLPSKQRRGHQRERPDRRRGPARIRPRSESARGALAARPYPATWVLWRASGINDQGQILGDGLLKEKRRGFLLTPLHP